MIESRYHLYYQYELIPKLIKMHGDGELIQLKVAKKKRINCFFEFEEQYKGHVDTEGNVIGWGSFEIPMSDDHEVGILAGTYTGTFLDNKLEGIVVRE